MTLVLIWAIRARTPSQRRAVEARIGHEVGAIVQIDRLSFPRPGEIACRGVSFRASVDVPPFAQLDQLRLQKPFGADGGVWWIRGMRSDGDPSRRLMDALMELMLNAGPARSLFIDDWKISPPREESGQRAPLHIASLRARTVARGGDDADRRCVEVVFRLMDQHDKSTARLRATWEDSVRGSPSKVEFDTATAVLPCWTLAHFVGEGSPFEAASTFSGGGAFERGPNGVAMDVHGTLRDVELGALCARGAAGWIRGRGTLAVDSLQCVGNRIASARGTLRAANGEIDPTLLDAAVRALYCVRPDKPADENVGGASSGASGTPFDEFAARVAIDESGLMIWGECESTIQNALFARGGQPMLLEPKYEKLPLANLVYLFAPDASHFLPASREAQAIARWLPFPASETNQTKKR